MGSAAEVPSDAVRAQVHRLHASPLFAGSGKLLIFLDFLVSETLRGDGERLKEAVIGNAIYGRDPPYDPRIDSTVRVEARRLRRKLELYYAGEGRNDSVRITVPTGSYIPCFTPNFAAPLAVGPPGGDVFRPGPGAAVAVLPFRARTDDPAEARLADRLTDELVFLLVGERGFRVVSRVVALQHLEAGTTLAEMARELGVCGVAQGVLRLDGDFLRMSIEYCDINGFVMISDRMDAPAADPERAVYQIAATLVSRIRFDSSKMRAMQISPSPGAVEAHARVYRARLLLDRQTEPAIREALGIFAQVNQLAPDYARGHSGIADAYCDLFRLGGIGRREALAAAKQSAQRALEIDPDSIEGHCALGTVQAWLVRDRPAAEREFLRALEIGRNARTARIYGVFLTLVGRNDEAEAALREAREVEPLSTAQEIAETLSWYQTRRFDRLRGVAHDRLHMLKPPEALAYAALGCVAAGDGEGARRLRDSVEGGCAGHPDLMFAGAEIDAWLGERDAALALLEEGKPGASAFAHATLAAAAGVPEEAVAALRRAVDRLDLSTAWIATDVRFDGLRDRADFAEVRALLDARVRR